MPDQSESTAVHKFMTKMDEQYAAARQAVLEALASPQPDEAARLVRWIIENGINPYAVFSDPGCAECMASLDGILGIMHSVRHAIRDDGDICYPVTEVYGPYVSFIDRRHMQFEQEFERQISLQGHASDVIAGHKVIGFAETIDDFMESYEVHEKQREADFRAFFGPD